jgi:phosphoribosylanthranilate isomerase
MNRVLVKICGLTRIEDVPVAVDAGADAVGFVFASSPRQIGVAKARELSAIVPGHCLKVGVFMDQPIETVNGILQRLSLDLLQFHGNESEEYCAGFGLPWLKALSLNSAYDLKRAGSRWPGATGLLCDSAGSQGAGGTGVTFDWSLVQDSVMPLWLAGGLNPGNVSRAIRSVKPYAVDVSSGVEKSPGIKSEKLIRAFIAAVRQTGIEQAERQPTGLGKGRE